MPQTTPTIPTAAAIRAALRPSNIHFNNINTEPHTGTLRHATTALLNHYLHRGVDFTTPAEDFITNARADLHHAFASTSAFTLFEDVCLINVDLDLSKVDIDVDTLAEAVEYELITGYVTEMAAATQRAATTTHPRPLPRVTVGDTVFDFATIRGELRPEDVRFGLNTGPFRAVLQSAVGAALNLYIERRVFDPHDSFIDFTTDPRADLNRILDSFDVVGVFNSVCLANLNLDLSKVDIDVDTLAEAVTYELLTGYANEVAAAITRATGVVTSAHPDRVTFDA